MSLPAARNAECGWAPGPAIHTSPDGSTAYAHVDVLTYNIEGLPWPARRNRTPYLEDIARRLAAFRAQGEAPDIVVFQEVFSNAAARAVTASGYGSIASGPRAGSRQAPNTEGALPGSRRIARGEIRTNFTSSGLVIASDFPMLAATYQPFARGSCAGFDCLSNKGASFARIAIPGIPGTLDVFNTHMQSQGASGVSVERHAPAHQRQTVEMAQFASDNADPTMPTILASDFNLRNSDIRFEHFTRKFPLQNVHQYCSEAPERCEVLQDWEHPDQWRRVQNKHFFSSGDIVKIRPIRAKGMFDGGPSGPVLSDHNGFRVIYEFSWPAQTPAEQFVCPLKSSAALAF